MKQHLLDRFPEHAQAIHDLSQGNAAFEELVHRYGDVVERLRDLGSAPKEAPAEEVANLKKRRAAVEEELLLMINSNRP
jgi:uncharacterized protein YdcH (DUF465 family)